MNVCLIMTKELDKYAFLEKIFTISEIFTKNKFYSDFKPIENLSIKFLVDKSILNPTILVAKNNEIIVGIKYDRYHDYIEPVVEYIDQIDIVYRPRKKLRKIKNYLKKLINQIVGSKYVKVDWDIYQILDDADAIYNDLYMSFDKIYLVDEINKKSYQFKKLNSFLTPIIEKQYEGNVFFFSAHTRNFNKFNNIFLKSVIDTCSSNQLRTLYDSLDIQIESFDNYRKQISTIINQNERFFIPDNHIDYIKEVKITNKKIKFMKILLKYMIKKNLI